MIIDDAFLDQLEVTAISNPRLRQHYDLRTSESDSSQRMVNVLMPGTSVPIHRHLKTSETVVLLRGSVVEVFFDNNGKETARFALNREQGNYILQIPQGQWHSLEVEGPSAIFEAKDGSYVSEGSDEMWSK